MKRRARNLYLKRGNWWFARQIEGKRLWVNLHTSDESEAIKLKTKIEHAPQLRPTGSIGEDVAAFIDHKQQKQRFSRNSAQTKVLVIREFAEWLPASTTSAAVTSQQCDRFYRLLQGRVAESTAQGYMMSLRSFFRWVVEVKRLRLDNPVAKVELARADSVARERFCERSLANRLIENAPNDDLRFILYCGFHAGLRRDEICEARRHWFDLRAKAVNVRRAVAADRLREGERLWRPKYNKERTVPLTKPFQAFLKEYLADLEPLAFPLQPGATHGVWRYRYDFRRPFAEYMKAQQVPWVTPHVMRHSFASNLKIAGKSIAKIADWLGDTERVTERNYAHLMPDDRDIHALA